MTKERKTFLPIESESICVIYNILHEAGLVSFGINEESRSKLDAIVTNINGSSYGVPHYKSIEEKIVAYMYFIINDHVFTDGNKRTAVLVFSVLCRRNDLDPVFVNYSLDAVAVFLEALEEDDHQMAIGLIAKMLFKNQAKIVEERDIV